MAMKYKGFRERKDFSNPNKKTADGWIEELKKIFKPGQVNAHIVLVALKTHMDVLNSDIASEMIRQEHKGFKFDNESGDKLFLNKNNTQAYAEVFAYHFLPSHICNLAIVKTEKHFGTWNEADLKAGLGTGGEVTNIAEFGKIVSKYGAEILTTMRRRSMLENTPILINDEEMFILFEDMKISSQESDIRMQYAIIRPEVVNRIQRRMKGNTTFRITAVLDLIIDYNELVKKAENAFSDCKKTEIKYDPTFADSFVTLSEEDKKIMDERDLQLDADTSASVDVKTCYFIMNPAMLNGLVDYRQEFEETNVRKDFVPLSTFKDKKGYASYAYLPEIITEVQRKKNDESSFFGDKEAKKEVTKKVGTEEEDKVSAFFNAANEEPGENITTIVEIKSSTLSYLDDRAHTTRALEKIRQKATSFFNAKNTRNEDTDDKDAAYGYVDISKEEVNFEMLVSSLDPVYFKTTGFKNAGYYSTADISSSDTLVQLANFITGIFSASKVGSYIMNYIKKLSDISDMRSGHMQDVLASDYHGMKGHFIEASRADYLLLANSNNMFYPTVSTKIKKKRIKVIGEDAYVTGKQTAQFNKNPKVTLASYYSNYAIEDHQDATILPNGIAYVMLDSSGNLIDVKELTEVTLPVPTVYTNKTETLNVSEFGLDYSSGSADTIVKSYLEGYAYAADGTDLNVEYKDLVVGVDFVKELKGTMTVKKLQTAVLEERPNNIIDYQRLTIQRGATTGMDNITRTEGEDIIYSIVPKTYKQTRPVTGLDMLKKTWRELIFSKAVQVVSTQFDRSRKIIKEPNDIYGIMAEIESNTEFVLDYKLYGGYLSADEQKTLTELKITGKTIRVSDNFVVLIGEIATAIKKQINMEFNDKIDVIDEVRDINNSVNVFQIAMRNSIIKAISGYDLIERLYILKHLFDKTK